MKYFWIPMALLALLLGASLANARLVEAEVEPWREAIESSVASAEDGDWEAALRAVRAARESWDAHKDYLHIVTAHDELDRVDILFATAEGFAREEDMAEFRAEASELAVQLGIIVELQKLTLRNTL